MRINVIDLANIYSCPLIATKDLGKTFVNNSFYFLIILACIWIGATILAVPQAVAFEVVQMPTNDDFVPQCLPKNVPMVFFKW